jgi:hypothetical protein
MLFNLLGAVGLVGLLSGCGSGGGGATTGTGGTASGTAASSGTVTGFGSIYVNGKKFESNDVEVRRDDGSVERCSISTDLSSRCGLKEGMTVKVSGTFNGSSRSASTITQGDTVEGPITTVDVANSKFDVLGQTVIVDNTTRFDSGVNLGNLLPGQFVEVSGFVKSDGTVAASFIERKSGVGGCSVALLCEVKGTVKGHNAVTATFQIGGLTVVYDNTTIIGDMPVPSGSNWNDRFVEVKGTNFIIDAGVPTLTATKVEPENQGAGNAFDEFEVEGFVTQAGTANGNIIEFTIGTTPVKTTASTEFRGGTVDEIVVGAKMSAEGRFDGTTLIAKHVKFHAAVKLEGDIATINGNSFTIDGLPGVTVTVNSQTEGGNNLLLNSHVRVRGRVSGSSSVIATRVEQRSQDTDVDLQGPVQSVSGQVLTILEVDVDTTGIDNTNFEGLNDQIIGRAAFFNTVNVGTLVKVKGRLSNGIVTWREAELED